MLTFSSGSDVTVPIHMVRAKTAIQLSQSQRILWVIHTYKFKFNNLVLTI